MKDPRHRPGGRHGGTGVEAPLGQLLAELTTWPTPRCRSADATTRSPTTDVASCGASSSSPAPSTSALPRPAGPPRSNALRTSSPSSARPRATTAAATRGAPPLAPSSPTRPAGAPARLTPASVRPHAARPSRRGPRRHRPTPRPRHAHGRGTNPRTRLTGAARPERTTGSAEEREHLGWAPLRLRGLIIVC